MEIHSLTTYVYPYGFRLTLLAFNMIIGHLRITFNKNVPPTRCAQQHMWGGGRGKPQKVLTLYQ